MAVTGIFDNNLTEPKKDTSKFSTLSNNLNGGLFSNIKTGENKTGDAVVSNVNDMLSGDSYDAYKAQANQKLSRAIANLRNSVGTQYGGSVGQGSYNRAQQGAEQSIFSQMADNNLQADVEKNAMKERGITAAQNLAQGEAANSQNNMATAMQSDTAYGYTDQFGNKIRGSNELAGTQTDIQQQQADTQKALGFAQIGSSEKIAGMNISSNEKIATQQLGLDAQKLTESARQFNISTQEAASQFTQKLNFDYSSLSQQDKQFLSSLGLDEAKFNESKRQYDTTTALEDRYRTKDLDIKEQALAQEATQFTSRLDFDKWATKSGLDDAAASRIWQATQNDKQLENAYSIANMQNNTEVWKTNEINNLTKSGWAVEDARALADRQQQITMFNLESVLTRDIENGRINQADRQLIEQSRQFNTKQEWVEKAKSMDINEADANRIWATNERLGSEAVTKWQTTYEGQIQREAMQQQLSIADKQLLEEARQFDSKEDFDRWAVGKNLSEAENQRLWQTNERIANNIHQGNLQALQNAFTEKGWGYEGVYNSIQALPPEQAAQFIQDMAESAGITHTVVGSNGEAIEVPGFENFSQKAFDSNSTLNANLAKGAIPTSGVSVTDVKNMTSGWDTYVEKYPNLFVSAEQGLEGLNTNTWRSGKGTNWWGLSDDANTWVNNNVGKLVKGADGKAYKVVGKGGDKKTNGTQYIVLTDISTGKTVKYSSGSGGSQKLNFVQ